MKENAWMNAEHTTSILTETQNKFIHQLKKKKIMEMLII